MPEKTIRGWNCTVSEMAEITGLTRKTIHDAIAAGCPVVKHGKGGKGNPTVISFYEYLQWRDAKRPVKQDGVKDRLHEIRIEKAELDLAEKRGDLVHANDWSPFIDDVIVVMRGELIQIVDRYREVFVEPPPINVAVHWLDNYVTTILNRLKNGLKAVPAEAAAAEHPNKNTRSN